MLHLIQKFNVHFHIEFIVANVVEKNKRVRERITRTGEENTTKKIKLVNFVANFSGHSGQAFFTLNPNPHQMDVLILSWTVNHYKTTKNQTNFDLM